MTTIPTSEKQLFEADRMRALDAIDRAQLIAFAPYVWEASRLLRDKGILKVVEDAREQGISMEAVAPLVNMSLYGVRILLEAGLGIGLVYRKDGNYFLTKTGHIFLNHEMTKVNFEFMRDVCFDGAHALEASIEKARPEGLKAFGNWNTIYEGLSVFPDKARKSWLAFDHYYSDNAFPDALKIVFERGPSSILDIGANTGKWTLQCLAYDDAVKMGVVDLPGQIKMTRQNIDDAGFTDRVNYYEIDMLKPENKLPKGFDIIWMSQFLDCFSDEEIVSILEKCYQASEANTRIFINETFWDRQRFPTSAFSLQMTSLYFTTMANGNSQMYDSAVFCKFIEKAGFEILACHDLIGLSHTILELKKR